MIALFSGYCLFVEMPLKKTKTTKIVKKCPPPPQNLLENNVGTNTKPECTLHGSSTSEQNRKTQFTLKMGKRREKNPCLSKQYKQTPEKCAVNGTF
ncbi:hypothetical protein TNCV_3661491 [Trichonephila clavipes]|nr:hypothetical protein TNCV_3661491 [Trichonephila clavipes]